MTRSTTFPKTGRDEWTNRETGVKIGRTAHGMYVVARPALNAVGIKLDRLAHATLAEARALAVEVAEDVRRERDLAHGRALDEAADRAAEFTPTERDALAEDFRTSGALDDAHAEALAEDAARDHLDRLADDLRHAGRNVPAYAPFVDLDLRRAHLAMTDEAHAEALAEGEARTARAARHADSRAYARELAAAVRRHRAADPAPGSGLVRASGYHTISRGDVLLGATRTAAEHEAMADAWTREQTPADPVAAWLADSEGRIEIARRASAALAAPAAEARPLCLQGTGEHVGHMAAVGPACRAEAADPLAHQAPYERETPAELTIAERNRRAWFAAYRGPDTPVDYDPETGEVLARDEHGAEFWHAVDRDVVSGILNSFTGPTR